MKLQLLALALTALATLSTATDIQFEGKYIRTEKLTHDGRKCLEWEVGIDTQGNRHHRTYIIPKCIKYKTAKEDYVYKLKVVKVLQNCLGWGVVAHGEHARCVCSKVQKRDLVEAGSQLVDRDDFEEGVPQGQFVRSEQVSKPGEECHDWRTYVVEAGDKHNYPTIAPQCRNWQPQEDGAEEIVYDTSVLNLESGCAEWRIAADGTSVRPVCALGTGKVPNEALKMDFVKRTPTVPIISTTAHKNLFKNVQKTVHTLQSQLAQAQHKHHVAKVLDLEHAAAAGKQNTKPNEQKSMLQDLQQTLQAMQTRLARAKHSVHAHFSKPTPKQSSSGIDQGDLQDLQHSVHTLQAQLAKARHVLHAHTGKNLSAKEKKRVGLEGLDQGVLQHMQHSAHTLQSELSRARKALHDSIGEREAVLQVEDGDEDGQLERGD